jgi:hypothetical protein
MVFAAWAVRLDIPAATAPRTWSRRSGGALEDGTREPPRHRGAADATSGFSEREIIDYLESFR